jgi:hypothetical protein
MSKVNNLSWVNISNPIFQALIALTGVVSVDLIAEFLQWIGMVTLEPRFAYLTAASFLLCFAILG